MCSIAGIVSFTNSEEIIRHIFAMNSSMQHRGPDDEGYTFLSSNSHITVPGENTPDDFISKDINYLPANKADDIKSNHNVAFAHNRLSIIDTTRYGHQPMCDKNADYWIVYNGEVYNYREIRRHLEKKGHTFLSNTDSEVVLKSYMEWGKDCVQHFNGMWAFTVYDKPGKKIFASRDRFGVKPFYYIHNKYFFAFASEQKALYHFPGSDNKLNDEAVFDYLGMGLLEMQEEGLVKGVMELQPSHSLQIKLSDNSISKSQYYTLDYNRSWGKYNKSLAEDYAKKTSEQIREAVNLRLNAEVPVGTCLSGGIDSSVLVTQVNKLLKELELKQLGERQKTFTASYKNPDIDESMFAKLVVEKTHADWHQVYPTATGFLEEIEDLAYCHDVPFLGTSTYSQYKVMELARQNGIVVTLDGQGGDELFGGYAPHYSSYMINALKVADINSFLSGLNSMDNNFSNWKMLSLFPMRFFVAKSMPAGFISKSFRSGKAELENLQEDFWDEFKHRLTTLSFKYNINFNEFLSYQFGGVEFKTLMRTGDRNSMRFSVESRMPFADDIHLIESVFSIPSVYKIRNGYSKSVLRKSASKMVPEPILLRRDKKGFATPEEVWFRQLKDELKEFIPDNSDQYLHWDHLKDQWDNIFASSSFNSIRLWRFINFSIWRKIFKF